MDRSNEGNYIKINRSILEWEWWSDINTCRLFIYCLIKANWKESKFQGTIIPRGSFVSSIQNLAAGTNLTADEIRTALKHLQNTMEITKQSNNKYTVFTVVNYSLYQDISQANTNQIPINSQSIPKLFPTIEEGKKGRREEDSKEDTSAVYQYQQVIDYLNQKAGTSYRGTSKDTRKHIKARFDDGFTLEDFYTVIDKKVAEWGSELMPGEKDMRQYLRPSTLFSPKFEGYLNQKPVRVIPKKTFNQFEQKEYDFDALEKELLSN